MIVEDHHAAFELIINDYVFIPSSLFFSIKEPHHTNTSWYFNFTSNLGTNLAFLNNQEYKYGKYNIIFSNSDSKAFGE